MNILIIASNYFPRMCGYSTRLHGIVSHLAELGHSVTILTPRYSKEMNEFENYAPNITVIRYPYHGLISGFTLVKKIHKLINSGQYDLVSGHSPLKNAFATYLGNRIHHLPFILVIHYSSQSMELPKKSVKYKIWNLIDNFVLSKADKIVVISDAIKKDLIKRGISYEKIVMLPNAVDINKFSPQPKSIKIEKKYNLNNKKIIMYLGKFQPWEQLDKLVKIFAKIKERQNNVKLLLVGDGPDRKKIEKIIKEYNLTKDVTITGFVPFSDVPKYYSVCDVFVMVRPATPHLDKTTPIKPFEAMSMGKVVISTDIGGMREIIEDGKTGFLVSHSMDAIVDKTIEVLNNPQLREEIGANARRYVKENRDWKAIINNLDDVYEEVIKKHVNSEW